MPADESSLLDRIRARIEREGPLTFADFMEEALYDPDEGFYAAPPIGANGHFVTSPHVSSAFAALLARQLAECWDHLANPDPFTVVELGAGDGTLAGGIREALGVVPELAAALRYVAVERTPGQVTRLRRAGLETVGSVGDVGPITGCVIANELLDNLPFHRLRERDGRLVEVRVGVENDRLIEVEAEPAAAIAALVPRALAPGEERPVSPEALDLVREIAASLHSGYGFLFDYGFLAEDTPGPVHAYRGHEVLAEVLDDPGSRDITAAVDLELVAAAAGAADLQVWGPVTQRDALMALGYEVWATGTLERQTASGHDPRVANRLYAERSRASILIDPTKLGGLYLLALGTEGLPAPAAVQAAGGTE